MKRGMLWLTVGFLGNGFAQFLQKYLHAIGLGQYQTSALVVMYLAGTLFALLLTVGFETRVARIELLSGLGVGLCSYFGNLSVLRALGYLPAYSVFPIVVGGPIVLVALFSKFFLGEHLNRSTNLGILCGVVAVLLLTLR